MEDRGLGLRHAFIQVGGIKTHLLLQGEGPPLLLIHGLGVSVAAWRENLDALASRYSVYAVDLPGHGDSDRPDMEYSLDTGLSFMSSLLDSLALRRVALVGNSMGGLLALRLALAQPERVGALVLVDSAGLGRELVWFLRAASLPLVGEMLESTSLRGSRLLLKQILYDSSRMDPHLLTELFRVRSIPGGKRAILRSIRWGVNLRGQRGRTVLLDGLSRLTTPLLIIWGAQDRIIPVDHAHRAHRFQPDSQLHVFEDSGHWPQFEKAEAFNGLVMRFLEPIYPGRV